MKLWEKLTPVYGFVKKLTETDMKTFSKKDAYEVMAYAVYSFAFLYAEFYACCAVSTKSLNPSRQFRIMEQQIQEQESCEYLKNAALIVAADENENGVLDFSEIKKLNRCMKIIEKEKPGLERLERIIENYQNTKF